MIKCLSLFTLLYLGEVRVKSKPFHIFFFIIGLFFPLFIHSSTTEKFQIKRTDDSMLTGYITLPDNRDSFPVAFIIHGSQCESIWLWHKDFNMVSVDFGAALVTLEKQGIYSPEEIDLFEYDQTNTFDHRVEDHLLCIQKLREGEIIPQWNGRLLIIGGSEGGRVAISLSTQVPEIKATALYTCGGGLPTEEELKIAFLKFMISFGESDKEIAHIMLLLDEKIHEMIANPSSEKYFLTCTYKWWSSHLSRHFLEELIQINHPIFYAHGTADQIIPIESADKVAETFRKIGKENFIYMRLEDYDHDMRTFPHSVALVMFEMLESLRPILFSIQPN
jgi:predicted esterase